MNEACRWLEDERATDNDVAGVADRLDSLVAAEHWTANHGDIPADVVD